MRPASAATQATSIAAAPPDTSSSNSLSSSAPPPPATSPSTAAPPKPPSDVSAPPRTQPCTLPTPASPTPASSIFLDFDLPAAGRALPREDQARIEQVAATGGLNLPAEVRATLDAEKRYGTALKHWQAYETWKRNRNPARAALERAHGYDTKHAMHLIRLMRMGLEVLETGELHVRRPDAPDLTAIREGSLTYDGLIATADDLHDRIRRAAPNSTLPDAVDHDAVDALPYRLIVRE